MCERDNEHVAGEGEVVGRRGEGVSGCERTFGDGEVGVIADGGDEVGCEGGIGEAEEAFGWCWRGLSLAFVWAGMVTSAVRSFAHGGRDKLTGSGDLVRAVSTVMLTLAALFRVA